MAGYGLGFGSHRISRHFVSLGQNVPPAVLRPSTAWTGVAGSGLAGPAPVDPPRITAKPVCRLLTPPNQYFTTELVIGVWASANHMGSLLDNLGIEKVIAHCEGNRFEIEAPSFYLFADANGQPRRYLGWWVVLQHPGIHGHAQVWFEAIPKDPAMQPRVIGPFQYSPQPQLHDHQLEVAPSLPEIAGLRYQTLAAALNRLTAIGAQNPLITITEAFTGDLPSANLYPGGAGYCTITATAPVTFRKSGPQVGAAALFRPRVDGLWFRGENITFDFRHAAYIYHENPANRPHVFEGVRFHDSGGRDYTYLKGQKPTLYLARNRPWLLECTIEDIQDPANGAETVRGCRFTNGNRDVASGALAVIGCTISGWSSDGWRTEVPALSVHYSGASTTATLELSGGNDSASRILTAREDGAVVGSFAIANSEAAHAAGTHYHVANVVDWLNTLPGWNATLLDDSRRASALSLPGNNPKGGAFAATSAKGAGLTLVTTFDQHPDLWALDAQSAENVAFVGNLCFANSVQSLFVGPPGGVRDAIVANNAFHQDPASPDYPVLRSQLQNPCSHLVVAHNSWANQTLLLRSDTSLSVDGFCLIANNMLPALVWQGSALPALTLSGNHLFAGAAIPAGALGTTTGGTLSSLFAAPEAGDFTPLGDPSASLREPVLRHDRLGMARAVPAPPGALADGSSAAPAITSSNPSGTYPEGQPISGALAANKPVLWSVLGPDADAVSLDPHSGAWALEPTDFEARAHYAFTFRATDGTGDHAEQVVAIAIADLDEIAPELASPAATAAGQTTAVLTVSTNEANGALFWQVSQSSTPPAPAELLGLTGGVARGSQAVSQAGMQSVSVSGLVAATSYHAHFLHRDGAGNASTIISSPAFVTQAPPGGGVQVIAHEVVLNSSDFLDRYGCAPFVYGGGSGRMLLALVALAQQSAQTIADLTARANGTTMTRLAGQAHAGGSSRPIIGVFALAGLGAGPVSVEVAVAGNARSCSVVVLEVAGLDLAQPLANASFVEGLAQSYSRSYTPVRAGNLLLSCLCTRQGDRGPFTADAGLATIKAISTGSTATNDHSCFAGYRLAPGTAAIDVGASIATNPEVLFAVAEFNAA